MPDVPLMENPMTTGGDVIYGGASGAPTRLANGSGGQVLTSAGGTSAPTWETPSGSGGGLVNPFVGTGQCLPTYGGALASAFVADRAYIQRFVALADVTVSTAYWNCTTSAGNMDFAIYNSDLSTKLGSTGSFASPGTGARSQALGGSVNLTAGTVYYVAWATDSGAYQASQQFSTHVGALDFFGTQNSAGVALPATLATSGWTTNGGGGQGFPVFHFA